MLKVQAEGSETRGRDLPTAPTKWPGSQALALMAAAVLVFLGAAAITVPTNPGSWGVLGGVGAVAALLAGASSYEWLRIRSR